jgi:uncharacterized metal-binding protein YceD (DUF177 family)
MATKKTDNPSSVPWSVPVAVEEIPDTGLHIEIDAPAATRAELAALAAVRDLPKLSAVFDVTRRGAKVHIAGQVIARVEQNCVVTLEPIEQDVAEVVDVTFAPPPAEEVPATGEVEVKADKEPPEPLVDGKVDLGALATEFLVLGVDPYPRKAGVSFSPPKVENVEAHPFAALAALKKPGGGGQP